MRSMPFNTGLSFSRSTGAVVWKCAVAALSLVIFQHGSGSSAFAQQLTPDQIIEALKSRTSRGLGPRQPATEARPGQEHDARDKVSPDAAAKGRRMSELLEVLRKRGARAFTAKQREELADLSQDEPSVNLVVYFDLDSATVRVDSKQTLAALGTALKNAALRNDRFLVSGHTDASGGAAYNLRLSQRRAEAVSAYLRQAFGIESHRLQSIGYGEEQLKRPDEPMSGENRRVQVVNVSAASAQAATGLAEPPTAGPASRPVPASASSQPFVPSTAPAPNAGPTPTECRRFSPQANRTVPCD